MFIAFIPLVIIWSWWLCLGHITHSRRKFQKLIGSDTRLSGINGDDCIGYLVKLFFPINNSILEARKQTAINEKLASKSSLDYGVIYKINKFHELPTGKITTLLDYLKFCSVNYQLDVLINPYIMNGEYKHYYILDKNGKLCLPKVCHHYWNDMEKELVNDIINLLKNERVPNSKGV